MKVFLNTSAENVRILRNVLSSSGTVQWNERIQQLTDFPFPQIYVDVPVKSLDCGNRRMKKDLMDALRVREHPKIEYRFNRLNDSPTVQQNSQGEIEVILPATGGLALAGNANTVAFTVTLAIKDPTTLELSTKFTLRMTSFQIEPPTALMGLIKAHDQFHVTVRSSVKLPPDGISTNVNEELPTLPGKTTE